jgi:hypothetical protein
MAGDVPENKPKQGRWAPGQSGNPGGRPRDVEGIRELIRKQGTPLVERLMRIALGTETRIATSFGREVEVQPTFGEQTKAMEVLLSYWLGKPVQAVEVSSVTDHGLTDQLETMRQSERGAHLLALAEAIAATQQQQGGS